jgi:hypothetical protein
MDFKEISDIVIPSVVGILFLVYHLHFWFVILRKPHVATLRLNLTFRKLWVRKVRIVPIARVFVSQLIQMQTKEGIEITAVQSLRNLTMASTLLATTSVGVAVATITGYFSQGSHSSYIWFFSISKIICVNRVYLKLAMREGGHLGTCLLGVVSLL